MGNFRFQLMLIFRCIWLFPDLNVLSPLFLDPFADAVGSANEDVQGTKKKKKKAFVIGVDNFITFLFFLFKDGLVHIRIQQRNGRKTLTTVQGLSANYDLKKIVRTCKKVSF